MDTRARTAIAYLLLLVAFLLTVPWCAGIAWMLLQGAEHLSGFLWAMA